MRLEEQVISLSLLFGSDFNQSVQLIFRQTPVEGSGWRGSHKSSPMESNLYMFKSFLEWIISEVENHAKVCSRDHYQKVKAHFYLSSFNYQDYMINKSLALPSLKWQCHSSSSSGQKPWTQPWFHSFLHSLTTISQQILLVVLQNMKPKFNQFNETFGVSALLKTLARSINKKKKGKF